MKTYLDCIPCLLRQIVEASSFFTRDEHLRIRIMKEVLSSLSQQDLSQSPPHITGSVYRLLRNRFSMDDPYRAIKDRFNRLTLSMLGPLRETVLNSQDPLLQAVKLAIAGNSIDCGAKTGLDEHEIRVEIESSSAKPLEGDVSLFRRAVEQARKILYIADNAGELTLDRLLIEQIGPDRVTVAVRGAPVINDATMEDARQTGLHELVRIIDNGTDAPGTIIEECSNEFRQTLAGSDLIIAKGQGNYETLCDEELNIIFLLKVKCPIIADHTGFPVGSHAVIQGPVR
ncbi:MAG TPA: ARMT1-like domain-containing protein [Spirochaetota bacterium]|nr:ARMT1-like domain-containing protein [Spirochaetota bacterium]HPI90675.1 ARMT1-like domain-containing protein [Spirochaetota bacterium]HPR49172.1 ARMT1-like domain-containing protein [Spirochaetota bacterium]